MKKNKMMRLASGLLVAVLITTSTISGTFAKYVTTADAKDEARVAKFGVVITATGSEEVFKEEYDGTVESGLQDKVVAPGTKNETGISFAITGTPEVDVKVTAELTRADGTAFEEDEVPTEVFLKAGTYADMTTSKTGDTFTLAGDYYPVVFTLTYGDEEIAEGSLDDIRAELATFEETFAANENLSTVFEGLNLTWAWEFGEEGAPSGNDFADTLLGDLAADPTMVAPAVDTGAYNLTTDFAIKVTVEQID